MTSPGQIYCFFECLLSLPCSKSLFSSSWSLLVSILSSQGDSPTLNNLDFASAGARFSKNQGLGIKDAIESALGVSWGPLGGLLGGSWGLFWSSWGIQMAPLNSKTYFFVLLMLYIAPRGAPNSLPGALRAKQMPPRSHQDASGDVWRPIFSNFDKK